MVVYIAQIIGIIAMMFSVFSFQCKKNRNLILALGIGSFLFSLNFMLLGAYSSAGFNLTNIFRSASYMGKKTHNNVFFVLVCLSYIVIAILTFDHPWTAALLLAQLVSTYSMWYKDGAFIRKAQLFFVSPIWLINNVFITFTIGGIICEAFTIISAIVSFIRFGKNGFEK